MNTSKKQINFNLNDFLPFIDGLDIAIKFSLVILLSSFLLRDCTFSSLVFFKV